MKRGRFSEPGLLALKYVLVACAWIVVSDLLLWSLDLGERDGLEWSVGKGVLFVVVTGCILHALARRMQGRIQALEAVRRGELSAANERLRRLNDLHAVLARANQAALTATEQSGLCREIATALTSLAGLRFAGFFWLNETTGRAEADVWAGDVPDFVAELARAMESPDAEGPGPTPRAILAGRVLECSGLADGAVPQSWRELLDRHGLCSGACVPMRNSGRRGMLAAYAGQAAFFDEEITGVMTRLARDLEHGLDLIAARHERARTARQLNLLRTAIEAAPSGIVITDALGRVEWVNPAFSTMTGYALADVTGKNPRILKSGRHGPAFYAQLWDTITRGRVWSGDLQNQRRDGSVYWEHMVIAPVVSSGGAIERYVAIKHDISAQRDMELQMARAQRLEGIGLLAGGIAHDLNNVLAPILMSMDLFKLRYTNPVDQARLELVRKSAERGASIVRQVLTFARGVDGERMNLKPVHLVKEVRNFIHETLPRNIEIVLELAEPLPTVSGDATQLHQVLLNLAVNARDAMPRGGVLTLSARCEHLDQPRGTSSGLTVTAGDYVVLAVADTGTGIAPDVLERMFEPFFTTKRRGEGTGLGLSTVLGIVRGHGGGLDVRTSMGAGTEFLVWLPAVPTSGTAAPFAETRPVLAGEGRCILVVDDEEPVRLITGMILDQHGFAHVEAADGIRALEVFERSPDRFSAVILDRMMPHLDGPEVAARIKARRPALPVLFSSGQIDDEKSPAEGFVLRKPFTEGDLLAAMARVLN